MFLFATILKHVACQFCDNFGICLIIKVVKEKITLCAPRGKDASFIETTKLSAI